MFPGRGIALISRLHLHIGLSVFLTSCPWAEALTVYVSPAGNDAKEGTRAKPLATLSEALLRLRGQADEREIVLLPGVHTVRDTVHISAKDSGRPGRPLKIRGDGKDVLLSGFLHLPAAGWRKVNGSKDLQRINDPDVRDRLMQFRFNDADRPALGELSHRASSANGKRQVPPAMLYLGNRRMRIARWPNVGTIRLSRVVSAGVALSVAGGNDRLGSRGGGGIFRINSYRPKRWDSPADILACRPHKRYLRLRQRGPPCREGVWPTTRPARRLTSCLGTLRLT